VDEIGYGQRENPNSDGREQSSYLWVARELTSRTDVIAVTVEGVSDHVHVVTTLPRTLSQAELIEQIKKPSSKWIKAFGARYRGFSWQRGYAAFSVSPSHLEAVLQYVQRQEVHHRTHTFQDEYRELLRRHNIEFDEQYVWD